MNRALAWLLGVVVVAAAAAAAKPHIVHVLMDDMGWAEVSSALSDCLPSTTTIEEGLMRLMSHSCVFVAWALS